MTSRLGAVDAVVVYHADRLHRHPRELEDFIDLCQRTKTKIATVSGDLDLSTHEGQLLARITGAVARKESDDKSRRIRRKHEELAAAGKVSGGGTPPVWVRGGQAHDSAGRGGGDPRVCAAVCFAGDSLRSICTDLNERGVATVDREASGRAQTLRRMLDVGADQRPARASWARSSRRPSGRRSSRRAQTQQLRAKLSDPDRRTNRASRRYLLTRLLRCSHCKGDARCAAACGRQPPLRLRERPRLRRLRQDDGDC